MQLDLLFYRLPYKSEKHKNPENMKVFLFVIRCCGQPIPRCAEFSSEHKYVNNFLGGQLSSKLWSQYWHDWCQARPSTSCDLTLTYHPILLSIQAVCFAKYIFGIEPQSVHKDYKLVKHAGVSNRKFALEAYRNVS